MMEAAPNAREPWSGDVLDRKRLADFLSTFLIRRYADAIRRNDPGAICFALDGPWGAGKSFFITEWMKDLKNAQHPVILFDAWKNDLSEEPLVGLLAALRDGMEKLVEQLPVANRIKAEAVELRRKVFSHARRAVMPVSAVIAKGLIKRVSGIEFDALVDSVRDEGADASGTEGEEQASEAERLASAAIDKYFEVSLQEHTTQLQAIDKLKQSVGKLLAHVEKYRNRTSLPVFVFIDELDRCRPNYAIKLLEGLKHLLDVRGLCFCVSTNFNQLCESIRAAYGAGFDSHRYLKRFFAFEYSLPEPSDSAYAKLLVASSGFKDVSNVAYDPSLEEIAQMDVSGVIAETFCKVACAFGLDLRSQKQVFDAAEAATTGLGEVQLHVCYLFILAALRHSDPQVFDSLQSGSSTTDYSQVLRNVLGKNATRGNNHSVADRLRATESVVEIFSHYQQLAIMDLKEIEPLSKARSAYPPWILDPLHTERPSALRTRDSHPPSIRQYAELIRRAGQIRTARSIGAY